MKRLLGSIVALFVTFGFHVPAFANGVSGHRSAALHFTHPIIVDSPSPDTKVRLDYFYRSVEEGGEKEKEHEFALGFEYAFHPSISIEKAGAGSGSRIRTETRSEGF